MAVLTATAKPMCPRDHKCSEWARIYMGYCLCSFKDGVSLTLGLISVVGWGIAEIPQIVTNYKQKSAHGLSLAFLATWIVGDLFNLFGCMLEPATLPTQYYMAVLYTATTLILAGQAVYYDLIYHRLNWNKQHYKGPVQKQTEKAERIRQVNNDAIGKQVNKADIWKSGSSNIGRTDVLSSPIPLPAYPHKESRGRGLYYMSARSLSSSHTPTTGSILAQKMHPRSLDNSIQEPLIDGGVATQSEPSLNIKPMLCTVSAITFFGTLNLHQAANNRVDVAFKNKKQGFVMQVGRKILQVSGEMSLENDIGGGSRIGSFMGWAMATIYMGGRLPQICLNIKRGNVEGLNPLMFLFALVGNSTYVASILVSSLEWSKIRPNLPWLVDAGGCVLLDTFILIQFIYFHYRVCRTVEK